MATTSHHRNQFTNVGHLEVITTSWSLVDRYRNSRLRLTISLTLTSTAHQKVNYSLDLGNDVDRIFKWHPLIGSDSKPQHGVFLHRMPCYAHAIPKTTIIWGCIFIVCLNWLRPELEFIYTVDLVLNSLFQGTRPHNLSDPSLVFSFYIPTSTTHHNSWVQFYPQYFPHPPLL